MNKTSIENNFYIENDEVKNNNFHLAKSDDDLFHDESYIPYTLIRAKRVKSNKNGEYWQILEDGKEVLKAMANRFSKKEREFLYTPEGMSFLVSSFKEGNKSVIKIKKLLKKKIK